jgi:UDP-N-acetylmuramate dehydrogenase
MQPEETALPELIHKLKELETPFVVLGNGSNVLVRDKGFPGAIVSTLGNFKKLELSGKAEISCGAGISIAELCEFAAENALTGLEFAYGIPGSAGGAVYMNAGAYGGEMRDVVRGVKYLDEDVRFQEISGAALDFSYRRSAFTGRNRVITEVRFSSDKIKKGDPLEIRAKMDDLMARRKSKQPLEFPSAGSAFKRPEGAYASALIDRCGLKGLRVGGAQVSEKHAGFIINAGGATCADVQNLIKLIQETVKNKTGFDLECEIKIIG